ncbi:MAG: hypothetical protein HC820_07880 [Hydrococcus sp. RM1_1_31]|nr:hypothetical protein [Hydrococcus sp. RM1_1_31]
MAKKILGQGIDPQISVEQLPEIYQAYREETGQIYPVSEQPIIRALKGESLTIDDMKIDRGDTVIPLEVSADPIFDEKVKLPMRSQLLAILLNASEQRQSELNLPKNYNRQKID